MGKKIYQSKTVWVNVLALAAIVAQVATGHEVLSVGTQAMILSGINVLLRVITKEEITWS